MPQTVANIEGITQGIAGITKHRVIPKSSIPTSRDAEGHPTKKGKTQCTIPAND